MLRRAFLAVPLACTLGLLIAPRASASPWIDVGNAQARSDVEILAAAGLIDNVTMQWPLPWAAVLRRLDEIDSMMDGQPEYVRDAARRLEEESTKEVDIGHTHFGITGDVTNSPAVVRGFDALGREDVQGQATMQWIGDSTAINLQVGAQTANRYDRQTLVLDNSYVAQRIGNIAVYAGYMPHWWGPGWDTALSISNNARPFLQIGYRRVTTRPFSWPVLSWLGPWNHEMFFGVLDGPRLARNTVFHGTRWEFNPLPGLDVGVAHLQELCGSGHPCEISELINVRNSAKHPSKSKDETDFDVRYTGMLFGLSYSLYTQEMDRDTGPFVHSYTSHLFGASLWVPVRSTAVRFTAEYASTISTVEFFSFGKYNYGITYNDYKYTDGWQYRGRTLGSSLDTDSRLASLHASWLGPQNLTYTLSYYRAWVGSPNSPFPDSQSATRYPNRVSTEPVAIDVGEARVSVPFRNFLLQLGLRLQDDQPRPDRGFTAAGELSFSYRL